MYCVKFTGRESVDGQSTTFTWWAPKANEFGEITKKLRAITTFKVIQGYRFWYQSIAHIRLPIKLAINRPTNLPPILHRFQVMAIFLLATGKGGCFTLTPSLRAIPCEYRYKWYTANLHSQNVSVYLQPLRPQIYRILWNNTKLHGHYTVQADYVKITDFGTNRKPICYFLLVINSNLPAILHRFQVMADYLSNFR